MYDEPRVASGSGLWRKSKHLPDHKSKDGNEMHRLDAKAKCAWDEKSTSELEDWEGSKVTESVGLDSNSGLEPVVGKGKAPVRGEKLPAKVGGGSTGTKVEVWVKTQAQMSGKSNPNWPTATLANDPTLWKNPTWPCPVIKAEKGGPGMADAWRELKWKEEAEQNAQTFQIDKANALEAQRNGMIDEDIHKTTWTPAEHGEIYNRVVANQNDKVAVLWTEPTLSMVQKCILGAKRVPSLFNEFIMAADEILADWEAHYSDSVKPMFYLLQAAAHLCEKPTDFPTLDFSIALHAAFWMQCWYADKDINENVPALHALHQDIQHELATGLAILRRVDILEQAEPLLCLPYGTKDQALESLALSWRNRIKDRFWYLPTWFSTEELVVIGGMLKKWTKEASVLYEKRVAQGTTPDEAPNFTDHRCDDVEMAQLQPEIDPPVPIASDPPNVDNGQTNVEQLVNGDKQGQEMGVPENNRLEVDNGEASTESRGLGGQVTKTGEVENASNEIMGEEASEPGNVGEGATSEETSGPGNDKHTSGEETAELEPEGGAKVGTSKPSKSDTHKKARQSTAPKTPPTGPKGRQSKSTLMVAVADNVSTR
ncbi:hypothetical protein FRC06_007893 [Ceratobasidium sp. 370]|nr:hypothetical protein FRC06_007893 [Ceratobasidium sp. 370]